MAGTIVTAGRWRVSPPGVNNMPARPVPHLSFPEPDLDGSAASGVRALRMLEP